MERRTLSQSKQRRSRTRGGYLAGNLETLLLLRFATHMLVPSKTIAIGEAPIGKVPRDAPSLGRSLFTLLLPAFATQMLIPSKAMADGPPPTA